MYVKLDKNTQGGKNFNTFYRERERRERERERERERWGERESERPRE